MSITDLGMIFQFIGGLGMFLYGMGAMADGLQKFAGNRLQKLLGILTTNRVLGVLVGAGVTAIKPYRDAPIFSEAFRVLGQNPILGILTGLVVTAVIQSSSASVGILQTLAINGMVNWQSAIFITLGQNIGTCVTALLSCIGTSRTAKRAAVIHLLFNVFGTVIFGFAMFFIFIANPAFASSTADSVGISVFHTIFNITNTVLLFPFAGLLVKASDILVRKGTEKPVSTVEADMVRHLDDRILETPSFAIENAGHEIINMAKISLANVKIATAALLEENEAFCREVFENEETIDRMEKILTEYLLKINNLSLNDEQHLLVKNMYYTIGNLERIGDHSENLAELARKRMDTHCSFTDSGLKELKEISDAAIQAVECSIDARAEKEMMNIRHTARWEEKVDNLEEELRESHMDRLSNSECTVESGVIFLDAIANYERIADHAKNVAGYVKEEMQ